MPITVAGLRLPARVQGRDVDLAIQGRFKPRFWAGVNLGSTVPGTQPGQVAAQRSDYDRWLAGMGALGVRVVRIYTILRPAFYDALLAYNTAHPDGPLYVIQGVWIPKDAQYLYLLVRLKGAAEWQKGSFTVGFTTRPGGNRGLPSMPAVDPQANVALVVRPGPRAKLYQAAWNDPISFQYGMRHRFIPVRLSDLRVGSGAWVQPRLILNRPETIPATGRKMPVEIVNLGNLPWGTANPSTPGFDSRNLIDADGQVVEVRVPWELLGFSDPSRRQVYVPQPDGTITSMPIARVGIAVATPGGHLLQTNGYSWDIWNVVQWHERRKAGWNTLKDALAALTGG